MLQNITKYVCLFLDDLSNAEPQGTRKKLVVQNDGNGSISCYGLDYLSHMSGSV